MAPKRGFEGVLHMAHKRKFQKLQFDPDMGSFSSPANQALRRANAIERMKGPSTQSLLMRQVKALVASKKRDAPDVNRSQTYSSDAAVAQCLTSTTNASTAASGTGIMDFDGDAALINHITVKGRIHLPCYVDATPVAQAPTTVRKLCVWYNKPLLVASAAGTLPPVTEVLVTDDIQSQFVTDSANSGRFTVLSDRMFHIGTNTVTSNDANGSARISGPLWVSLNYKIKVNKSCHFAGNCVSGTPAGHYDSDLASGRIDKGLIVMYTIGFASSQGPVEVSTTRLNYTA